MFLAPFLQNFGVRRMLPYTPPVTQLRDPNESCHVRKSEAAPHPQSPARRRTKHRGASGGRCRVAAMKKWLPPSAHIPALVRYAAVPRPRKPDAGSGRTPQLLSTSPAPRATHRAAAATTARPEVTRCPSSRARPPAPPPHPPPGARKSFGRPRSGGATSHTPPWCCWAMARRMPSKRSSCSAASSALNPILPATGLLRALTLLLTGTGSKLGGSGKAVPPSTSNRRARPRCCLRGLVETVPGVERREEWRGARLL